MAALSLALARSSPVDVLNQPLSNPTGGYASYVVPAAFMLILQQTLLMGVATLGAVRRRAARPPCVLGQALRTSWWRCRGRRCS